MTIKGVEAKIISGKVSFDDPAWDAVSAPAKDFVRKLLTYREEDRPTAAEALEHPWVVENSLLTPDDLHTLEVLDNLKDAKDFNLLRQKCYDFICQEMLEESEKKQVKDVFRYIDSYVSGTIKKQELRAVYDKYGKVQISD